jgi:hypothetical protein
MGPVLRRTESTKVNTEGGGKREGDKEPGGGGVGGGDVGRDRWRGDFLRQKIAYRAPLRRCIFPAVGGRDARKYERLYGTVPASLPASCCRQADLGAGTTEVMAYRAALCSGPSACALLWYWAIVCSVYCSLYCWEHSLAVKDRQASKARDG